MAEIRNFNSDQEVMSGLKLKLSPFVIGQYLIDYIQILLTKDIKDV